MVMEGIREGVVVKRLTDFCYVINGKVFCFDGEGMFDMGDPEDVNWLASLADKLYTDGFHIGRVFGDRSVCMFFWLGDDRADGVSYGVGSVETIREPERTLIMEELGIDG